MIHLQWETTASPEGDLLASPNFGICDTTQKFHIISYDVFQYNLILYTDETSVTAFTTEDNNCSSNKNVIYAI